ncbi:MAG: N-acetyltransferase [Candidatus Nitrohelix vancouverensis]|uniref:N-acetyltransferase n=1 Tax=Candidatus Nitrohelix vancouverensis TaxID=2705534 RepID=A0A7T0C107_9BACT|nr:MAG: N-acetyltransferase [Candidatus Nitrohelix vancouverensis]
MIRNATTADAVSIHSLICIYAEKGQMLARSYEEIESRALDFLVYVEDDQVVGACSLKFGWNNMVEIRSLAVDPRYYRRGIGTALVSRCVELATQGPEEKIFVFTYIPTLFEKLGFYRISKDELPMKVWNDCKACLHRDYCDEIALIRALPKPVDYPLQTMGDSTTLSIPV